MLVPILLLILGLALVVFGSDYLVDGASQIARKSGVSEFVIGLTIVGFGTSCPELVVSLTGAFHGSADISLGNVVGSNIMNSLLILGLTAVLTPIAITESNKRKDVPMLIGTTLLFVLLTLKGSFNWIDGVLFLLIFGTYMFFCFRNKDTEVEEAPQCSHSTAVSILMVVGGIAALIGGGQLFVDNAVTIAHKLGVSEKFIAITLLAGGTSLPELVTCIVAAAKHKEEMALGNIIGSNLFNILLIIGCSSLVRPLSTAGLNWVDLGVLVLSALMILVSAFSGRNNKIGRFDGATMLVIEAAYMVYLFVSL